jgi:hypothetical protein
MAINFPTSLDTLTNPEGNNKLNNPSHSGQHADLNDAVEALQAKVGIDSSAVESSHDYKLSTVSGSNKAETQGNKKTSFQATPTDTAYPSEKLVKDSLDLKSPLSSPTFTGVVTIPNTGLHLLDTNASHDLIIKPGSDLSADRTLTLTTGNTDMIVDFTAVTDEYVLAYDVGTNTWRGVAGGAGGGASTALDNLASVAINTSLISDTDSTDDLGSSDKTWKNGYINNVYGLNGTFTGTLSAEVLPEVNSTYWTVGTGWAALGTSLNKNAAGTGTAAWTSGGTDIVAGTTYKIEVVVASISGSTALIKIGNNTCGKLSNATTYTFYSTALTTDKLVITPLDTALRMEITSISVKSIDSNGDVTVDGNLITKCPATFNKVEATDSITTPKLYLNENSTPLDPPLVYLTERPSAITRRIMMFGEPQSNSFGFVVGPTTTTYTDTNIGLWGTNIDAGGDSNFCAIAFGGSTATSNLTFSTSISAAGVALGHLGDISFKPKGTEYLKLSHAAGYVTFPAGNIGVGAVTTPTARLHLPAGTATASTAPLKLTQASAVVLTTPEAGAIECNDGDELYYTIKTGPTRKTIAFTDSAITSSMYIGTTEVALNRSSAALTLAGITLTTPNIGTPSAGTLTNCTGLPISGLTSSTSTALGVGSINLGHASDTTLSRSSAGVLEVEGVVIPSISSTNTLTNKRITPRVTSETSSATPTINTDNSDAHSITALATDITSMTTNLSGTPTNFQKLIIRIKDDGTARAIAWGVSFEAKGVALPTTTVISKVLTVGFIYDSVTSKWGCVASNQEV